MATECRETKKKYRINRRTLAKIQCYGLLISLFVVGFVSGNLVQHYRTPERIKTVTVSQETAPEYTDELPQKPEVTYYNVPLSHNLQDFIYEVCSDEGVPVSLVIAMIDHESSFNPETVSETNDYGLMQINEINHGWLEKEYRSADMLDSYQNVFCGIKILSRYIEVYGDDYHKVLMAYNMGDYGAQKAWNNGITSSSYSKTVIKLMETYEAEVRKSAESSDTK